MVDKKEIYVSIEPSEYKSSKASLLSSEIEVLNIMKRLEKLNIFREKTFLLKRRLATLFSYISEDLEKIEGKIPKSNIPRDLQPREIKMPRMRTEYHYQHYDTIEQELQEIQAKLEIING